VTLSVANKTGNVTASFIAGAAANKTASAQDKVEVNKSAKA